MAAISWPLALLVGGGRGPVEPLGESLPELVAWLMAAFITFMASANWRWCCSWTLDCRVGGPPPGDSSGEEAGERERERERERDLFRGEPPMSSSHSSDLFRFRSGAGDVLGLELAESEAASASMVKGSGLLVADCACFRCA